MKKNILLIYTFLFVSLLCSQNQVLDLGVDGKDLTDINFEDSVLVIKASEGGGAYSKEKNVEIKYINLPEQKILYSLDSEKDKRIIYYNQDGKIVISATDGFVGYGSNKDEIFIDGDGNEIGSVKDFNYDDIEWLPGTRKTFFIKSNLISVGPKKKGYKITQKNKGDEPAEWLLYKLNNSSLQETTIPVILPPVTGKEEEIGYMLMDVTDTGFYVQSKTFSPTEAKDDEYDSQNVILKKYDFEGKLVDEIPFKIQIDKNKYRFAKADLPQGTYQKSGNRSFIAMPTSASTGSVAIDEKSKSYYLMSVLFGKENNEGTFLRVEKYNFSGEKQWEQTHKFVDKVVGRSALETRITPIITNDKIYFFPKDYTFKSSKQNEVFAFDVATGAVEAQKKYNVLKGSLKRTEVWHSFAYGSIVEGELSDNLLLDTETLIGFRINNGVKEYLESLNTEDEIYFNSHIGRDGTIYMLEADYKSQKYKLLSF